MLIAEWSRRLVARDTARVLFGIGEGSIPTRHEYHSRHRLTGFVMPTSETAARLLNSIPEAAQILGISVVTTKRLVASGALKKVKIGSRVFIRASDIEAYVNSLTDDPTPIRKSS